MQVLFWECGLIRHSTGWIWAGAGCHGGQHHQRCETPGRGPCAHHWMQDGARLAADWSLASALCTPWTVVWALAVLSLPFLLLLLLTPLRTFPASWGRILTAVTMSPCEGLDLQDPSDGEDAGMELGCRRGGGRTPSPSVPLFPHSHSPL